jgi:hypothetical protein
MDLNVGKELAALRRMTVGELRVRYAEVFGETTNGRHKDWLVKRIIWRMQALAEGDLTERARRRAAELANDADLRRKAPKSPPAAPDAGTRTRTRRLPTKGDRRLPIPGSMITRVYKGETLEVKVRPAGFEYEGEVFKSLSAVAKKITGAHCNGYYFFRLGGQGGAK